MMIDVVLNPPEIALLPGRDLSETTCVVFDVLRATSSMITALAHDASEIWPARTLAEALELRERFPDALLGGERFGELIDGFDLGNSPFEYRENVAGRVIITTTTNGTVALRACSAAACVLLGALLNLDALVSEISRHPTEQLLLVCAGTFNDFAVEDACAAGWLITSLLQVQNLAPLELADAAHAAVAVARSSPDPLSTLRLARNGRALLAKGREAEVEWCAQRSRYNVVGAMHAGAIRLLNR